ALYHADLHYITKGMAEQFLYLSLYLMDLSFGQAIGQWVLVAILYKIGLSIVIGIFTGYVARKLLYLSEKNRLIDKESFLVFAIALALFLTGFVSIISGSDLLACFIAGTSFTWDDWFRRETEEAHLQEVIDMLLNLAVFAFIGSLIPWQSFA
ncbi:5276_t:CDS:2, partial [Acaulospora morrowiae]